MSFSGLLLKHVAVKNRARMKKKEDKKEKKKISWNFLFRVHRSPPGRYTIRTTKSGTDRTTEEGAVHTSVVKDTKGLLPLWESRIKDQMVVMETL